MTNTTEELELKICMDCVQVIAYAEISGIEDADAHLAAMEARCRGAYDGLRIVVTGDETEGDDMRECDTCGQVGTPKFAALAYAI